MKKDMSEEEFKLIYPELEFHFEVKGTRRISLAVKTLQREIRKMPFEFEFLLYAFATSSIYFLWRMDREGRKNNNRLYFDSLHLSKKKGSDVITYRHTGLSFGRRGGIRVPIFENIQEERVGDDLFSMGVTTSDPAFNDEKIRKKTFEECLQKYLKLVREALMDEVERRKEEHRKKLCRAMKSLQSEVGFLEGVADELNKRNFIETPDRALYDWEDWVEYGGRESFIKDIADGLRVVDSKVVEAWVGRGRRGDIGVMLLENKDRGIAFVTRIDKDGLDRVQRESFGSIAHARRYYAFESRWPLPRY
jgi:hypothetical protein